MPNFCVIGSNSFSGANMVNYLLNDSNNKVLGISRSEELKPLLSPYKNNKNLADFFFIRANIKNIDNMLMILDKFLPDYIVNYSALSEVFPSNEHPDDYFNTNVMALVRLCDKLKSGRLANLKRFVQISTCEVYGNCNYLVREDSVLNPTTPYAVTKAAAEMYLLTLFRHYDFPVSITRSTSVYGAYQQLYKVIPRVIINILAGKKTQVHGDGSMVRTFVHIKDACDGVFRVATMGKPGEIYNLSSENRFSVLFAVQYIAKLMGKELDFEFTDDRHKQDMNYTLDYSKAKQLLGWNPTTNFETGIKETVGWIEPNIESIKKESLDYVYRV